jgi:hypothetical protein
MAYSAVINFRNGIDITATAFGIENDRVTFTVASGLNALVTAGGLPSGVTNINPLNGVTSDTVAFCQPTAIRKVVIT